MNTQVVNIFHYFLKQLGVSVTLKTLKDYLLSHPDYSSFAAYADVCKKLQLDYVAIESSLEALIENGCPAIVQLIDAGGIFAVIEDINSKNVIYYHSGKKKKETINDFLKKWTKTVFYAIPNGHYQEKNYILKRIFEIAQACRVPFLIITILLFTGYFIASMQPVFSMLFLFYFLIKIAGLIVCLNLTIHSLDEDSKISQLLCRPSKHINCNDVLRSPAAKLFGLVSMSDIGFIYFVGSIFSLFSSVFLNSQPSMLSFLLLISICSVPYIIFSIYYQAFKVRK